MAALKTRLAEDGYALVPGVLDAAACDALTAAIAACRAAPGETFRTLSPEGAPLVQSELFRWTDTPAIRALTHTGALPALAAEAFGTPEVILMEDQWFWSEAGASTPSPWHQDHPYHPLDPWFLTIWIPLDDPPGPVGLRVAAGSHGRRMYGPVEFSAGAATLGDSGQALEPVPDIGGDPQGWRVITPPAARGDAVLMDSRTLHAAGGPCHGTFRRISIRYAHPDTTVTPRPWPVAQFWDHHPVATRAGASIAGPAFPKLCPAAG
ncbi:phytanoyl-CoA dioxygenase family protein [Celeribacter indicus]|uniref:Phytanoyl-CoA dioxygenase (PhyH) n=1 Tax=Celeribacter indicus TaxID=1208324 RepID=A0A0B5DTV1_9RHOB|nr:phytanoyl-CoA dioxygenase family protein [Celeribacter indicus]AJE46868.1 Phytanoyl-CoA dioxygenase (PhyH) [Celeribacter indicus]SDW79877.1 Phytanoyl-CoA dioxygenase (PhyH) [Celeribacter indicus]